MADGQPRRDPPEIADVQDPDVRRALRAIYRDLHDTVERHQVAIELVLEILFDKNITSMGDFKRHMLRLQQGGERLSRIHDQLTALTQQQAGPPGAGQQPRA